VNQGRASHEHPELPELTRLRGKIEENDRALVDVIRRRVELALEAGRIKRAAGIPVFDPDREREVEQRVLAYAARSGLDEAHMRLVVRGLIALARSSQEKEP
jgi:chorismate mutase